MRKRRLNGRTKRLRRLADAQLQKRLALLAGMALVIAALIGVAAGREHFPAWFTGLFEGSGQIVENAQTTPETAPVTPAPLAIDVKETELIAETALMNTESVPRVLIYHTHASEAYLLTEDEPYTESGKWRTLDNTRNVVAIGALLKKTLTESYGISVIHDTTNYEAPKLATAYNRSLTAMEACLAQYPSITLFIDVHRDAYGNNEDNVPRDYIELDGRQVARVMLVVGTGEGATGTGFPEKPDFDANYALAQRITDRLQRTDERMARDIRVKTGRYNQHVSSQCMLVEVGHTANTFQQAQNAVPYLAAAIAEEMKNVPSSDTLTTMQVWAP